MSQSVQPQGQILPYAEKLKTLRGELLRSKSEILKALPNHLDAERMFRLYLTCAQVTPRLGDCLPVSVVGAVMQSAQLGLSLEGVLGEAYLIPRRNKNVGGAYVAHFQIGYKGLRKLARQADSDLRDIFAVPVFKNDVFDYELGLNPTLTHRPVKQGSRGHLIAAYAVAWWKDEYKRFFVADEDVITKARQSSDAFKRSAREGTNDSPWHTHPEAMWQKTAIIRLCGQMTLSSDSMLARALVAEQHDGSALRASIRGDSPDILVMPMPDADSGSQEQAPVAEPEKPKGALDNVVAQARSNGNSESAVPAQPAPRRRRAAAQAQRPAPEPKQEELYDPETGEVPPEQEPSEREPGED